VRPIEAAGRARPRWIKWNNRHRAAPLARCSSPVVPFPDPSGAGDFAVLLTFDAPLVRRALRPTRPCFLDHAARRPASQPRPFTPGFQVPPLSARPCTGNRLSRSAAKLGDLSGRCPDSDQRPTRITLPVRNRCSGWSSPRSPFPPRPRRRSSSAARHDGRLGRPGASTGTGPAYPPDAGIPIFSSPGLLSISLPRCRALSAYSALAMTKIRRHRDGRSRRFFALS